MNRGRLATVALGIGAAVCAAGALAWWASADRLEFYTGAGVQRANANEHDARDILWRAPKALGEPVASGAESFEASVPAGGPTANNEILFARVSESGDTDLYAAERVGRAWSAPRPIVAINTLHNEQSPRLSAEGAWLYFASDRPGGEGGLDLWRAPRTSSGWGEPENLGPAINTRNDDAQPAIDPSSGELWFASDREAMVASDGEDGAPAANVGGFDLYRVRRAGAELVETLSSAGDDVAPAFSPVGDFVYFASSREGGAGGMDLYRARLSDGVIGTARSLGPPVNSDADELDPAPASEGFELFFTRASDDDAVAVLLRTVSREVDLARDVRYGDLAALLRLLPWILLVLAIVLLLSMLRRLASGGAAGASLGALSLMAKCVLVSLILHAILLALLSLWMVEPEAGELADADSGTRVSLASSSIRSALESQVRDANGDPVNVAAPDVADSGAPAPIEMVAATSTPELVMPEAMSGDAPQRASVAPSRASELRSTEQAAPVQPVASATPDMAISTPSARAAQRAQEAEARIDDALDVPSPQLAQAQVSTQDALRADATIPLPQASRGDDHPARRAIDGAAMDARPAPLGAPIPAPSSITPSLAAPTPTDQRERVAEEAVARITVNDVPVRVESRADLPLPGAAAARVEAQQADVRDAPRRAQVESTSAPTSLATDAPAVRMLAPGALALPTPQDSVESSARADAPGEHDLEIAVEELDSAPREIVLSDALRAAPVPEPDAAVVEARRRPDAPAAPAYAGARTDAPDVAPTLSAVAALRLPQERPIPVEPEPDSLAGMVLDAVTSAPIEGARVRLDLADAEDASATSDPSGAFTLRAFDIPDNSAISASAPGYIPYSANITADELEAGATAVILLWPESMLTVALEDDPEVHHLGNDAFTGRVNSQFQRRAEGLTIEMPFELSEERLPPNTAGATLLMLAKGVQLDNRFYVNGRRLQATFPESPRDGSFGDVAVQLPIRLLREGRNTLGIESIRRGDTDYDDFEFVNVRIQLIPANVVID